MDRPPYPPPGSSPTPAFPGEAPPAPPTVDPSSCALLGPPALLVQGGMTLLVLVSLLVKRQMEQSKRTKTIWVMDVSKQLVGQALVHASNLLISDQVAHHGGSDACASYLLNVLVDTTLGVLFIYVSLKAYTYLAIQVFHQSGCISGKYGRPPRFLYLAKQTALYLAALVTMKLLVLLIFLVALPGLLLPAADWVLGRMSEWGKVVFVMAVFPLVMNVLQFCLIDSLIKAKSEDTPAGAHDPLLPKHVDDLSDSENEDGAGERRGALRRRASRDEPNVDFNVEAATSTDLLGQAHRRDSFQVEGADTRAPLRRASEGSTSTSTGASTARGRPFAGMSGLAPPVPGSPLIEPATPGQSSGYGSNSTSPALVPLRLAPVEAEDAEVDADGRSGRQRGRSRSREQRTGPGGAAGPGDRRRSSRRSRSSRSREPRAAAGRDGLGGEDDLAPFELDAEGDAERSTAVAVQVARILDGPRGVPAVPNIHSHRRTIPDAAMKEARRSLSSDSGLGIRARGKSDVRAEDVSLEARLASGARSQRTDV